MDPEAIRAGHRVPHGGESDQDLLDFSANTNPQTPPGVREVYANAFDASRRYPDDEYADYRAAAGAFVGCAPDRVVPTPGGLAAIRLALESVLSPGDRALIPYPSFGEYEREVRLQGGQPRFVRHDDIGEVDTSLLADCALVIVCTPNNPTGEAIAYDTLAALADRCAAADTTLLVDEAFLGFTELPSAAGIDAENVVVARSLTKLFGLPGLRAGFAIADGDQRARLETARRTWSLGTPAARVGTYCLRQESFVRETRARVASERDRLRDALDPVFTVRPSAAPYLLCDVGDRAVDRLLAESRADGVVIRDARTFRSLDSHIRVAIKDRPANDRLLAALGIDD